MGVTKRALLAAGASGAGALGFGAIRPTVSIWRNALFVFDGRYEKCIGLAREAQTRRWRTLDVSRFGEATRLRSHFAAACAGCTLWSDYLMLRAAFGVNWRWSEDGRLIKVRGGVLIRWEAI